MHAQRICNYRRPHPRDATTLEGIRGIIVRAGVVAGAHSMTQLARIARTVARVSRTRYPAFIAGLPLRKDEIPVFTYHDVESESLAGDLEFLHINGYRTLSLEEYLHARARSVSPGRSVLLTFDDARRSFWTTALPVLRAFDARAVLFAPTYWMDPPRAACDDLFMSWRQLRACAASGLVEVQSHAHLHALVYVAPRLVGFAAPATLSRYDIYDWPMRRSRGEDVLGRPAPGSPVYRAEPLLSARRRYLENEDLQAECCEFVARHGGEEFFRTRHWAFRLRRFHRARARRLRGRYMDAPDFCSLMESEFERSRAAFTMRLGYAPHCIAYPWMLGSERSLQLARRHGLRAAFGVALDYRAERRARSPIPVYGRLKCDWLQFLPGAHRSSLMGAVRRKLAGFAGVQHLAH